MNRIKMNLEASAQYIERIEIEGLWDRFDVDWRLHPDVNVLIGKNGTGKTTILLIIQMWSGVATLNAPIFGLQIPKERKHNSIAFTFDNGGSFVGKNEEHGQTMEGEFSVDCKLLRTFDTSIMLKDEYDRQRKPHLRTYLDKTLEDLIDSYVDYQLKQSQKALRQQKSIEEAFAKRKYFIETLNRLFSDTGKRVDENQNRISFLLDETPISTFQLSSGEKQLLIMLLTVLVQDEQPLILLLDEPESSLHLEWQYELIEILRTLNPNCQLIIVTHSPSIFTDGHKPKVFWIEDILQLTHQLELAE